MLVSFCDYAYSSLFRFGGLDLDSIGTNETLDRVDRAMPYIYLFGASNIVRYEGSCRPGLRKRVGFSVSGPTVETEEL